MSDWKSLILAFVSDHDMPRQIGDSIFGDEMSAVLISAHGNDRKREFNTNSFDYLLFLDPFLLAYGLPKSQELKRVHNSDDGEIRISAAITWKGVLQHIIGFLGTVNS